jgi:hypothetical protein
MQATRASVVCLDCVLENLLPSSCDVDLRSVGDQSLCDHQANSCSSTCNDGRDMRYIEEDARLELLVGTLGYKLSVLLKISSSQWLTYR